MSRLIDADYIKEQIVAVTLKNNIDTDKAIPLLELIDAIPTAYDVEKVVEKLEEAQEKLETDMWAKESNNWYGEYCNGMSEGYDKAIDIVRKGWVE